MTEKIIISRQARNENKRLPEYPGRSEYRLWYIAEKQKNGSYRVTAQAITALCDLALSDTEIPVFESMHRDSPKDLREYLQAALDMKLR